MDVLSQIATLLRIGFVSSRQPVECPAEIPDRGLIQFIPFHGSHIIYSRCVCEFITGLAKAGDLKILAR